jgi:hypothetical protein
LGVRATLGLPALTNGRELPIGRSGLILAATLIYLVAGLAVFAVWQLTGNIVWLEQFFSLPSALFLIWLSGLQLWFSRQVCGEFSPGEPMLLAWKLISISALVDLAGTTAIQLLSGEKAWNPLVYASWWSRPLGKAIFEAGHVLQGTCRFALLAAGLWCVLKLYRISGFLGRLRIVDWLLLAAFAGYVVREGFDLAAAFQNGKRVNWGESLLWPVDPMLWLLFAEAMLLHRSVQRTGIGLIGRCWRTFSAGILLTLLGDLMIWAASYGYLPWPWSSLSWYVWMPAAASFALAPAYQLEAMRWASSGRAAPVD